MLRQIQQLVDSLNLARHAYNADLVISAILQQIQIGGDTVAGLGTLDNPFHRIGKIGLRHPGTLLVPPYNNHCISELFLQCGDRQDGSCAAGCCPANNLRVRRR
ncbi:hypothetical protein D3C75_1028980 [compost metagenome]